MCRKKSAFKKLALFTGKHLRWNLFVNEDAALQSCSIMKKRLQSRCFPIKIAKFLRTLVFDSQITHTGVDYFGPITTKRGKQTRASTGTGKRNGVVFTCLMYRAIPLELTGDLSTDCFIMTSQRFTSRRGYPRSMWSDNGQNFVEANQKLRFY